MSQENNDTTKPIAEDTAVILNNILKQVEKNRDVLLNLREVMALNLGTLAEEIKQNKERLVVNQMMIARLLNFDENDLIDVIQYAKSHERLKQH